MPQETRPRPHSRDSPRDADNSYRNSERSLPAFGLDDRFVEAIRLFRSIQHQKKSGGRNEPMDDGEQRNDTYLSNRAKMCDDIRKKIKR